MFQIGVWNQLLQLDVWRFLIANCESWRCMRHTIADNRTWGGTRLTSPPTWTNNHYYWGFQKSMVAYKKTNFESMKVPCFPPQKIGEQAEKLPEDPWKCFLGGSPCGFILEVGDPVSKWIDKLQNGSKLGGGFKYFWCSPRKLGKMNPIWRAYFFKGVESNHQKMDYWNLFNPFWSNSTCPFWVGYVRCCSLR